MPDKDDVLDRWAAAIAARPVPDPLALLAEMMAAECDSIATEANARGAIEIAEKMDSQGAQMDDLATSRRRDRGRTKP